jgi:hypothetical protein
MTVVRLKGATDYAVATGVVRIVEAIGCHVLSEETQQGPYFLDEVGRKNPGVLCRYHQEWIESLARAAEAEVV